MKILVATKVVPDPEVTPSIDSGWVQTAGIKRVIDYSDEVSLRAAITMRRSARAVNVTAVCVGTSADANAFKRALAIGADDAVLIKHSEANIDSLSKAALIKRLALLEGFELILFSNKSCDNESGQTAQVVASMLGWVHLSNVVRLTRNDKGMRVACLLNKGRVWFGASLPCVLACNAGIAKLRYIRLSELTSAKRKKIRIKVVPKLRPYAKLTPLEYTMPPAARAGEVINNVASALQTMLLCLESVC
ncbi:MAG: hypothetical protein AAJB65_00860 [Candidatus Hodgkinia cicadicola]